ncbi:MAG: amidohydrolase family protein [Kordiimonas sp.]
MATKISLPFLMVFLSFVGRAAADTDTIVVDYLIENGLVYDGTGAEGKILYVGVAGDKIVFVGSDKGRVAGGHKIDASGLIVSPGFIDMHTHAYNEQPDQGPYLLKSYITQGVTTVISGNDGQGPVDISAASKKLMEQGIAANMGLYVGHGSLRRKYVGLDDKPASKSEMSQMKSAVANAMKDGALGLSTGLFYTPGSFAATDEVIELAKVAAGFGGIYDSHIRDESNYNVGLLPAVAEVIEIGKEAQLPVHIAHIKALGVDVWGKSQAVIELVRQARAEGVAVTADQYPWLASGTGLTAALVPKWARDGGTEKLLLRLREEKIRHRIRNGMTENMRRRGGAASLLLTSGSKDWLGLNLEEYAAKRSSNAVDTAISIIESGGAKIASFNMLEDDVRSFMAEPWVMTSSDGGNGHPRKFASYPRKYQEYVVKQKVLTLADFIHKSTKLPAMTLQLEKRGQIKEGYFADILVFDPVAFKPNATFEKAYEFSSGVETLLVNGKPVISAGDVTRHNCCHGRILKNKGLRDSVS